MSSSRGPPHLGTSALHWHFAVQLLVASSAILGTHMRGSAGAALTVFVTVAVMAPCPTADDACAARRAVTSGTQRLLILNRRVLARAAPTPQARVVGAVAARTPLTAAQTVLPVVAEASGPGGGSWLRVRLPTRPNGATGWLPAYAGATDTTPWRILIHRGQRRAFVYEGGRVRASFSIVVGKPSTPTPLGTFFIVEKLPVGAGKAGAPWALATSAYSNVLRRYEGGDGQVALHGTTGMTGALGTFSSHGCVRFAPSAITWLAGHVDAGTPVVVSR